MACSCHSVWLIEKLFQNLFHHIKTNNQSKRLDKKKKTDNRLANPQHTYLITSKLIN